MRKLNFNFRDGNNVYVICDLEERIKDCGGNYSKVKIHIKEGVIDYVFSDSPDEMFLLPKGKYLGSAIYLSQDNSTAAHCIVRLCHNLVQESINPVSIYNDYIIPKQNSKIPQELFERIVEERIARLNQYRLLNYIFKAKL